MSWDVLQSAVNSSWYNSTDEVTAEAFGSPLTAGTKLIAYVTSLSNQTVTGVSDGNGNDFTQVLTVSPSYASVDVWVLDTPSGDVGTTPVITATLGNAGTYSGILVQEVAGLLAGTSASLDGTPGDNGSNSATEGDQASPSYSSSAADEFLFTVYAAGYTSITWTAPDGYTADPNGHNDDIIVLGVAYADSTGGSESAEWSGTWSGTSAQTIVLGAFKVAAAVTVALTTPGVALAAPAPAVDSSPRVLLTAPNLALAAPAVSVRADMRVSLTSPNLALAAPAVSPAAGTIVNLTTPGLALAAPAVTPGVNENAAVALTSPNLALAAPAVTPQTSGVTVALTAPGLALAAPPLIPRGPAIPSVQGAPADRQARWAKLRLLGYLP